MIRERRRKQQRLQSEGSEGIQESGVSWKPNGESISRRRCDPAVSHVAGRPSKMRNKNWPLGLATWISQLVTDKSSFNAVTEMANVRSVLGVLF